MNNQSGVTLMEAISCVAIIGIMSTFAVPEFTSMRENARLRGVVLELVGDLQQAKLAAVKENHYVVVELAGENYQAYLDNGAGEGRPADWQRHDDERLILNRSLAGTATVASNFSGNRLRFSGTTGISPGSITVTGRNGRSFTVVISRVGRIRVEGPTIPTPPGGNGDTA